MVIEEETEQREVKEVSPTQGRASPSLQTCSRVYLGSSQAPIGHSAPCPVLWLHPFSPPHNQPGPPGDLTG